MSSDPKATVRITPDGQIILDDPDALAMMRAVEKHNCKLTLEMNADRIEHFKQRCNALGRQAEDTVIVIANVDDPHGNILANALLPNYDWQTIRDRGETPFARGLAVRDGVESFLEAIDTEALAKLRKLDALGVVVVDHGVAEIFAT